MDAINPTLALAAVFLGLAGHPRDAAEQPVHQTNIHQTQIEAQAQPDAGCTLLVEAMPDDAAADALGYTPFEVDLVSQENDYMVGPMQHGKAVLTSLSSTDEAQSIASLSDDTECGYVPPTP
jgi:hypothetical protein